tara:strand:+ start:123 stop:464 length:342 start_codon:yes stop_codon:yes gene_type:complete
MDNKLYIEQKYLFSNLQSNTHKLLNSIKKHNLTYQTLETPNEKTLMLLEINELVEILNSKLIDLNETLFISNKKITSKTEIEIKNKIQSIKNNNKTIEDLIPLFIMYRSLFKL